MARVAMRGFNIQRFKLQLKPLNPLDLFRAVGLCSGLYSYRFDSETVRSSSCTLTVVGRNE